MMDLNILGAANRHWNKDLYSCTFPALISEWRRLWSLNSMTNSQFPFGFVQQQAWRSNYQGVEIPEIRWHQTADYGYVPNNIMQVWNWIV
jgi:sialate O-acetylesterase